MLDSDFLAALQNWVDDQRRRTLEALASAKAGRFRTHEAGEDGRLVDTTARTIAEFEAQLAELDRVLAMHKDGTARTG